MSVMPVRSRWPATQRTTPGNPRVDDAHFPPRPEGPLDRTPRAKTVAEAQFLALGDGAALWLTEAAAAGCSRIRAKMAEAVDLAALHDAGQRWTARWAKPRPRAASATAIWPPSWPIRPATPTTTAAHNRHAQASTTAWPKAPAAGPGSVSRRRTNDGLPRHLIEDRIDHAQHRRRRRSRPAGRRGGRRTVRVGVADRRARRLARTTPTSTPAPTSTGSSAATAAADKTAWFAAHIAERIAALLDGDRGQP